MALGFKGLKGGLGLKGGSGPRPPSIAPPQGVLARGSVGAGNTGPPPVMRAGLSRPGLAQGKGFVASSIFQKRSADVAPPPPSAPSFIGASSRKRRMELQQERMLSGRGPARQAAPRAHQQPFPPAGRAPTQEPFQFAVAPTRAPGKPFAPPRALARAPPAPAPAPAPPPATGVKWIELGQEAPLVQQGFPTLAPTVNHNGDLQGLLSSSNYILTDLAGDAPGEVQLEHDVEWNDFPEIGEAVKAAGGEEIGICVAICSSQAKWAVGMGSKWKQREQAARLALCLALAANIDDFSVLAARYPEFTGLCESAGIVTGEMEEMPSSIPAPARFPQRVEPPSWGGGGGGGKNKKRKKSTRTQEEQDAADAVLADGSKLPKDTPLWICLPESDMPPQIVGLPPEALALSTDGNARKGLYSNADAALTHLAGDDAVEFHDDPHWEHFKVVGAVLKELADAEECICVATCNDRMIWAVGVGMKIKCRHSAAKAALAVALALQSDDMGEEVDLGAFPGIAELVEEAREARGRTA